MQLREILAAIEEIKKDLLYTQSLETKWEKEGNRFQLILKYIKKQSDFFKEEIEKLFSIQIDESLVSDYIKSRKLISAQTLKLEITPIKETKDLEQKDAKAEEDRIVLMPPILEKPPEPQPQVSISPKPATAVIPPSSPTSSEPPLAKKVESTVEKRLEQLDKKLPDKKISSHEKLRKLASQVLDEVKRSEAVRE